MMLPLQARPTDRDRDAKVLAVLLNTGAGVPACKIAERLNWPQAHVIPCLRRLVTAGRATEYRGNYHPAERVAHNEQSAVIRRRLDRAPAAMAARVGVVGQRDRLLKAIAAEPGITPERLATNLPAVLDEVDAGLCYLLERGQIIEDGHGYRRNGLVEMRV